MDCFRDLEVGPAEAPEQFDIGGEMEFRPLVIFCTKGGAPAVPESRDADWTSHVRCFQQLRRATVQAQKESVAVGIVVATVLRGDEGREQSPYSSDRGRRRRTASSLQDLSCVPAVAGELQSIAGCRELRADQSSSEIGRTELHFLGSLCLADNGQIL